MRPRPIIFYLLRETIAYRVRGRVCEWVRTAQQSFTTANSKQLISSWPYSFIHSFIRSYIYLSIYLSVTPNHGGWLFICHSLLIDHESSSLTQATIICSLCSALPCSFPPSPVIFLVFYFVVPPPSPVLCVSPSSCNGVGQTRLWAQPSCSFVVGQQTHHRHTHVFYQLDYQNNRTIHSRLKLTTYFTKN